MSVSHITFGCTWNRPVVDNLAVVDVRVFKTRYLILPMMLEKTVSRYTMSYGRTVREPIARVGEINSLLLHDSSLDF